MKIYHYTSVESWRGIKNGSWQSGDKPGLGALLRVCKVNMQDEGARNGAVFGLLEPEPEQWINNPEFPVAWSELMRNVGRLLVSYEPSDEIVDKSFVIDWSHKERVLGGHKDDLGKNHASTGIAFEDRLKAEKAYWASRLPLAEYIDNPDMISGLLLPEVITMCHVPFDMISIAETQPAAPGMGFADKELLRRQIEESPELRILNK